MTVKNLPEPPQDPFSRSFHAKRKRKKKGHWNDGIPGNKPSYTVKGHIKGNGQDVKYEGKVDPGHWKGKNPNLPAKGLWHDGIKGNAHKAINRYTGVDPSKGLSIQSTKKAKKRKKRGTFGGPKDGKPTV